MQRDGFNESLWQVKQADYIARSTSISDEGYDVVIVGGGVTGITTAFQMQKAGLRVLVAEARTLCFGTSGGTTAHLNNFFDSTYAQIQKSFGEHNARLLARSAREALDLYGTNVKELNIDCDYAENEGYLFALDSKQAEQLADVFTASQKAGVAVRQTKEIPLPIPFASAIIYEKQAQIHPVKYVHGIATAFEERGGAILQHCRVTGLSKEDGGSERLLVETSLGQVKTKKLVYATHIPPGVNLLHFKCSPWRSYVIACKLKDGNYPKNPGYDMSDPYRYYRTHVIDGESYLVAGGEDHASGKEDDTNEPFKRLEKYLSAYYQIDEISKKWSSQYFDPADGLAYIGHLPGASDNVFVACGFAGNGMTYSHIAASLLTSLVQEETPETASLFSPSRIKPMTALGSEIASGVSVLTAFVGDRVKIDKIVDESEIPRGEAKVVKKDGDSLAIYHDDQGKFHTVGAVCTHMQCVIHWNNSEKSWDCPCHGARFNIGGEMITGPADRDLPAHTPAF